MRMITAIVEVSQSFAYKWCHQILTPPQPWFLDMISYQKMLFAENRRAVQPTLLMFLHKGWLHIQPCVLVNMVVVIPVSGDGEVVHEPGAVLAGQGEGEGVE